MISHILTAGLEDLCAEMALVRIVELRWASVLGGTDRAAVAAAQGGETRAIESWDEIAAVIDELGPEVCRFSATRASARSTPNSSAGSPRICDDRCRCAAGTGKR
jgi:hypothetical protein